MLLNKKPLIAAAIISITSASQAQSNSDLQPVTVYGSRFQETIEKALPQTTIITASATSSCFFAFICRRLWDDDAILVVVLLQQLLLLEDIRRICYSYSFLNEKIRREAVSSKQKQNNER